VRTLAAELRQRGYDTELVSIPFKWDPKREILTHAAAWRLIDLTESNGQAVDLVIASKFPTYFVRHPNKSTWLLHQHRAAYELCGTEYSDFTHSDEDVGIRQTLIDLDTRMLSECRRVYTISGTVSKRLEKYTGLVRQPLYPPPPFAHRLGPGPFGDYALFVGRLESIKRPDLALRAASRFDAPVKLIVVGDGTMREKTERLAEELSIVDRVTFTGAINETDLADLYRGALCVINVPFDEDYGYVTLEAYLARKPVITATDSGGPLEFVSEGVNGVVCQPSPDDLAGAVNRLAADRGLAARMGEAGFERAQLVTWEGVIEKLVETA
jgi:glycosyltransferase involved in cell wall biosynthesis